MTAEANQTTALADQSAALDGQVAIVTGGSSGIGFAIARELDRQACRVVIAGRNSDSLDRAVQSLQYGTRFSQCDVRKPDRVQALFDSTIGQYGRIDIVVVSAGIGRGQNVPLGSPRPVIRLEEYEWDEVVETNLRGVFLTSHAAARLMTAQGSGQILNISSARGARKGQPCGAAYCASKMAVRTMFESLATELEPYGVRVMSLLPDAVDTGLIAGTTLGRAGALEPSDVARFAINMLLLPSGMTVQNPLVAPYGKAQ